MKAYYSAVVFQISARVLRKQSDSADLATVVDTTQLDLNAQNSFCARNGTTETWAITAQTPM